MTRESSVGRCHSGRQCRSFTAGLPLDVAKSKREISSATLFTLAVDREGWHTGVSVYLSVRSSHSSLSYMDDGVQAKLSEGCVRDWNLLRGCFLSFRLRSKNEEIRFLRSEPCLIKTESYTESRIDSLGNFPQSNTNSPSSQTTSKKYNATVQISTLDSFFNFPRTAKIGQRPCSLSLFSSKAT